jgi:hypothetical protein
MHSDEYRSEDDECDDGRQMLEEYEMHCQEVQRKATALLTIPAAQVLVRQFAQDLANLVQIHATVNGPFTLSDVLRGSVPEKALIKTFEYCRGYLHMPVSRAGFIAIRTTLDAACAAFEALLAAEASR